jgi:hypothetical protein
MPDWSLVLLKSDRAEAQPDELTFIPRRGPSGLGVANCCKLNTVQRNRASPATAKAIALICCSKIAAVEALIKDKWVE